MHTILFTQLMDVYYLRGLVGRSGAILDKTCNPHSASLHQRILEDKLLGQLSKILQGNLQRITPLDRKCAPIYLSGFAVITQPPSPSPSPSQTPCTLPEVTEFIHH